MNGLAVVAMADVPRHRLARQLHLDGAATTSNMGDGHQISRASARLKMRLSDAGLRHRQTKLIYPNHRLPSFLLTEDATRRWLEPFFKPQPNPHPSKVLHCPPAAKQIHPTEKHTDRV